MAKKRELRLPQLTTKAKIGFGVGFVVLIGALTTLAITSYLSQQIGKSDVSREDFAKKDANSRQKDAKTLAAEALTSGNDSKAADTYVQAIEAETDPSKKVDLAIDYSRMLAYSDKFDQAVEVAKKAEDYSTDKYLIYDWLARLNVIGKRYSDAADYYAKAEELVNSPTNIGGYKKDYYSKKVIEMKSLTEKNGA